jgi:hypothetical protein
VEAGSCKGDAANAEGNREAGWKGKRVMSFCELDEIAREGARRMIETLKARSMITLSLLMSLIPAGRLRASLKGY